MHALGFFADILDYPTARLNDRLRDCILALETGNGLLPAADALPPCERLRQFQNTCGRVELSRLEEIYTATFDMRADSSLYVGYQLFGDDWRRSSYLARLQQLYRAHGFSAGAELPDHMCIMLHFIAGQDSSVETQELITDCLVPALSKILDKLDRAANPYAPALEALLLCLRGACTQEEAE